MNRKKTFFIFTFFILAIFFMGSAADAKPITIKLAHQDPAVHMYLDKNEPGALGSSEHAAQVFKRMVEAKSNKQIIVKIYPNNQLGAEAEQFQSVQEGIIQMTMASGSTLGSFVPEYMAFSIPYLFDSFEIMKNVMEGPMGKEFNKKVIEKMGVRILAWSYYGFSHFTNNVRPIKSPADLKGLKIRVTETPDMIKMVESMGAQAVPINYAELYSSLDQGVVDGQENMYSVMDLIKIYEVQKYVTADGHRVGTIPFSINENFFQSLSPENKKIIIDSAKHAATVLQGTVNLGDTLWAKSLSNKGMQIYTPTAAEMKQFKEKAQAAVIPYVRSQVGDKWVNKVIDAVKRATKAYYAE